MKKCAYCGESKSQLTREHLFPNSLDREFQKDCDNPMREPYWLDRLDEKMVGGQPTIKDVCPECNNVTLSKLDSYGVELYKKFFFKIADQDALVRFEFDYDLLLRLILKLSYNSARANNADDLEHLRKYRWYVLGKHKRPARLALHLTLIFRHEVDEETKIMAAKKQVQISEYHTPDMLRIGRFTIQNPDWTPLISRTVVFQSFFFSIFSVSEKARAADLVRLNKLFRQYEKGAVPLTPGFSSVSIRAGMPSSEAINTHILLNASYYAKKFPNIF